MSGPTCASCKHIGVIYWDDGFRKTHHCAKSGERRRANFKSCGDASEDLMSEFRKFYDATADQDACWLHAERDMLSKSKIDLLETVAAAGVNGAVFAFFSPENSSCESMKGKYVDGGSFAYPNEPARGERRWFLTKMGAAEIKRAKVTPDA